VTLEPAVEDVSCSIEKEDQNILAISTVPEHAIGWRKHLNDPA
jgi:hypothetical protein